MEKRNIGKLIAGVVIIAFVFIAALMFGLPRYNVWQQEMAGKAEMAKAEQNRRILVEEAKAKLESGELATTLDVSDEYNLQSILLEDTTEELELYDNNDQPTMELFNRGEAVWSNCEQED